MAKKEDGKSKKVREEREENEEKIEKEEQKEKKKGGNGEERPDAETVLDEEARKKEEAELINKLQEEIDRLTTRDIVMQMMMSLSSLAYKKMGLPAGTNDKYRDKAQAKLAVDCFEALYKAISEEISAQESENLKSSLSNLQLNFVKIFL